MEEVGVSLHLHAVHQVLAKDILAEILDVFLRVCGDLIVHGRLGNTDTGLLEPRVEQALEHDLLPGALVTFQTVGIIVLLGDFVEFLVRHFLTGDIAVGLLLDAALSEKTGDDSRVDEEQEQGEGDDQGKPDAPSANFL